MSDAFGLMMPQGIPLTTKGMQAANTAIVAPVVGPALNAVIPPVSAAPPPGGVPPMLARPPVSDDYAKPAQTPPTVAPQAAPAGRAPMGTVDQVQALLRSEAGRQRGMAGRLDDITNEQSAAATSLKRTAVQEANELFETAQAKQVAADAFANWQTARAKQVEDATSAQKSKIAALDDIAAKTTVDPGRLLGSSKNAVIAGVASAFGEFARVMSGGQTNLAMKHIDRAIAEDVERQQQVLSSRQRQAGAARNQLADMRQQWADDTEAQKALMLAKYTAAGAQADMIAAKYQSPKIQAQNQELQAGLNLRKEQLKNELMTSAANTALKGLQIQGDVEAAQYKAMGEAQKAKAGMQIPDLIGSATSETAHKEATQAYSGLKRLRSHAEDLRAIAKTSGASLSPSARDKAARIIGMMVSPMGQINLSGALDQEERKVLKGLLPKDPSEFTSFASEASIDEFLKTLDRAVAPALETRGFKLPQPEKEVQFEARK